MSFYDLDIGLIKVENENLRNKLKELGEQKDINLSIKEILGIKDEVI